MRNAPVTTMLFSAVAVGLIAKLVVLAGGDARVVVSLVLVVYPITMTYLFWKWGILG